ncbi:MAG: DUF6370 family protein [Verrucomicrobiota bacterium]
MAKPLFVLFTFTGLALMVALLVSGADESTLKGMGTCAKCSLNEADTCQTVIQINRGDKTVNYYLVQNSVSKDFHDTICKECKRVKAKGIVKDVSGKKEFIASQIKLVKDE